jgi:predicted enzyme related to lactoylglutathione lyase
MIQGLRTVIYPIPDLAAGKAWYSEVLGIAPYFDQPYYVGFSVGGFELGLIPDGAPSLDGVIAYWGVANIDEEIDRLIQLGGSLHDAPMDVGGGIKVAAIKDPFGNRFGVIENSHFDPSKLR